MAQINLKNIEKKVKAYSKTRDGKRVMGEALKSIAKRGDNTTGTGDVVMTQELAESIACQLVTSLKSVADENNLPASIIKHFDSLRCSSIHRQKDGSFVIDVFFTDDLRRKSLYEDEYDGIENIIQLFNNGYHAKNYVYGYWDGHRYAGGNGDNILRQDIHADFVYIRSMKDREGLHFMNDAIKSFNDTNGKKYNVSAELDEKYT